jgi:alcohol dehydrogenase
MNQLSLTLLGKQKLKWARSELPPLEKDEILIRTIAGAVSIGAELPQYNESDVTEPTPVYPKETGYESFGSILKTGQAVKGLKAGDHVLSFYGHKDFAIVNADKVVKVPESIDYTHALLNTLSCDAGKGVLKLQPQPSDRVIVTGAGVMGLLTIHFLKNYTKVKQVDVLEPDEHRRILAKEFGAVNVYSRENEISQDEYDFGLECSASSKAFKLLLRSLKVSGEICILSDGNKDLFYLDENFFNKELKVIGSNDGWDYQEHSKWFFKESESAEYLTKLFDYKIRHHELIDCFADISKQKINPLKVLVTYGS